MKLIKRTAFALLSFLIMIAAGSFLTSCSGSNDCFYDASRYQIKSNRSGSALNVKPRSFKHTEPVRKKWIINNKRKPILGHK